MLNKNCYNFNIFLKKYSIQMQKSALNLKFNFLLIARTKNHDKFLILEIINRRMIDFFFLAKKVISYHLFQY